MNTFEYLAQYISEQLGVNYNILYNNNNNLKWDDILTDNMIHGVLHITGGQVGKISGSFVDFKSMQVSFAIPTEIEIFSETVQNINDQMQRLNGASIEYEGNSIQLGFDYITDASLLGAINGVRYSIVTMYCNALISDSVVFSNEVSIKIDNADLKGIISAIPTNKHSYDSVVKSASNGKVTNYLNSMSYGLTLTITLRKDDNLHAKLLYERNSNVKYTVNITYAGLTYKDSSNVSHEIVDTKTMSITEFTINAILGDSLKASIVLVEV